MFCNTKSLDLTPQEIEVIQAALHTQEKILSMQSKAGTDARARTRLNTLKSVLRSVRRQTAAANGTKVWSIPGSSLFGREAT